MAIGNIGADAAKVVASAVGTGAADAAKAIAERFAGLRDQRITGTVGLDDLLAMAKGDTSPKTIWIDNLNADDVQGIPDAMMTLSLAGKRKLAANQNLQPQDGPQQLSLGLDLKGGDIERVYMDPGSHKTFLSNLEAAIAQGVAPKTFGGKPYKEFFKSSDDIVTLLNLNTVERDVANFSSTVAKEVAGAPSVAGSKPAAEPTQDADARNAMAALVTAVAGTMPSSVPLRTRLNVAAAQTSFRSVPGAIQGIAPDQMGEVVSFFHGLGLQNTVDGMSKVDDLLKNGFYTDKEGAYGDAVYYGNETVAAQYAMMRSGNAQDGGAVILSGKVALGNVTEDAFASAPNADTREVTFPNGAGEYWAVKDPKRFAITGVTTYDPAKTDNLAPVVPDLIRDFPQAPDWASGLLSKADPTAVHEAIDKVLTTGKPAAQRTARLVQAVSGDAAGLPAALAALSQKADPSLQQAGQAAVMGYMAHLDPAKVSPSDPAVKQILALDGQSLLPLVERLTKLFPHDALGLLQHSDPEVKLAAAYDSVMQGQNEGLEQMIAAYKTDGSRFGPQLGGPVTPGLPGLPPGPGPVSQYPAARALKAWVANQDTAGVDFPSITPTLSDMFSEAKAKGDTEGLVTTVVATYGDKADRFLLSYPDPDVQRSASLDLLRAGDIAGLDQALAALKAGADGAEVAFSSGLHVLAQLPNASDTLAKILQSLPDHPSAMLLSALTGSFGRAACEPLLANPATKVATVLAIAGGDGTNMAAIVPGPLLDVLETADIPTKSTLLSATSRLFPVAKADPGAFLASVRQSKLDDGTFETLVAIAAHSMDSATAHGLLTDPDPRVQTGAAFGLLSQGDAGGLPIAAKALATAGSPATNPGSSTSAVGVAVEGIEGYVMGQPAANLPQEQDLLNFMFANADWLKQTLAYQISGAFGDAGKAALLKVPDPVVQAIAKE